MRSTFILFLICSFYGAMGQPAQTLTNTHWAPTSHHQDMESQSLVNTIPLINIGPRIMSGRVVDIAVNPSNTIEFYVAFASGGLWYTSNNGQSFEPVFDHEAVITIGAISVRWKTPGSHEIWVGTGEVNSSRSSYSGIGVFRSLNAGKSWEYLGLPESHHIGKIILHPSDPNTTYVAVLGHLYTPNQDRGVYVTHDAGKTWDKILYIDENTGCVNMAIDPQHSSTLYANMWYRTRRAWNFEESGKSSGVYKSTDAGKTWVNISGVGSGLPHGDGFGRSGIAVSSQNPDQLFCVVDNQNHRTDTAKSVAINAALSAEKLDAMKSEDFLLLENQKLQAYLDEKDFPARYSAEVLKQMVALKAITPHDIVVYTEDANTLLFKTPIIGAEIYRSVDGGMHWTKQNKSYMDQVYNTYGYYFGQIVVSPTNADKVFTFGVPILKSADAGATWKSIDADNMHGDFHVLWVDPSNPMHLICGNDGGVNISYDEGKHWVKCNSIPVAQCYSVNTDNAENYNVYTGLQDNNVWTGPHQGDESVEWHQEGNYNFKPLIGGDGMQVQVDTRDNNLVYTGYQFGNYFRINKTTGKTKPLQIQENIGEEKLRWNWNTPILISRHNQDILYWGSNKLHRSMDQGESWITLSDDLTGGKRTGDIAFATLTTIDESPLQFGLLYTGSDDGKIHVTRDGGESWTEIGSNLTLSLNVEAGLWVSRVVASAHQKGRVYVTLNGYRNDNFNSYVFMSDDYGAHWKSISNNLPAEPVNVIREDPTQENILYLGTDHGVFVSLNRGTSWMIWNMGMPNVPVHDMVIQNRDNDLVVGTHGRSIFIGDIKLLRKLNSTVLTSTLTSLGENSYTLPHLGYKAPNYVEMNTPELDLPIYCKHSGMVMITITDSQKNIIFESKFQAKTGVNIYRYNYTVKPPQATKKGQNTAIIKPADDGKFYISKGKFTITYFQGTQKCEQTVELKQR